MPREEQGVFPDRYRVIPRCLIFITRADCVLLLRGSPSKKLWANRYNGIGGHVEYGEDVRTAAERELFEETGLEVKDLWLCGNIMVDASPNIGITIFIFRGEYTRGEIVPSDEGELEWVEIGQIQNIPLVEDLFTLLPLILQMERGETPLIAHTSYDIDEKMIIRIR